MYEWIQSWSEAKPNFGLAQNGLNQRLDAAVFEAYGWPVTLTDEEILERLVALNAERAAEEARGLIRWLRPEFQNPAAGQATQTQLAMPELDEEDSEDDSDEAEPTKGGRSKKSAAKKSATKEKAAKKLPFPEKLPEQVQAIRQQLATSTQPLSAAEMSKRFTKAKADRVEELLLSLVTLGIARQVEGTEEKFVAA